MAKHHFIAKFTLGGGPLPETELESILLQADHSPRHEAWFATRNSGPKRLRPGFCILIAAQTDPMQAVIAEVVDRQK